MPVTIYVRDHLDIEATVYSLNFIIYYLTQLYEINYNIIPAMCITTTHSTRMMNKYIIILLHTGIAINFS